MLELQYKNKTIKADRWDELKSHELIEIFRRINASWYDASGRLELSTWLYTEQCSDKFIVNKIKLSKLKLYGPGDGFRNMSGGEFLFAETYYFSYLKDKDPENLNKFIASIFRDKRSLLNRILLKLGLVKIYAKATLRSRKLGSYNTEYTEKLSARVFPKFEIYFKVLLCKIIL